MKRILIYRIGNLGDTICAIPAMVALRNRYPDAWIGLLTNKETADNPDAEEVLKGNDFLDEIISYHPVRLKEPEYLINFIYKLHSLHIDLLIYLPYFTFTRQRLIRDWIFFHILGIRKIVGFKFYKNKRYQLVNNVKLPVFSQETDRLMRLLSSIEINPKKIEFRLPIDDTDRKNVDAIWDKNRMDKKSPVVAICCGGKFPVKRWPISNFIEVATLLKGNFGAEIVLLGGASEQILGEKIMKRLGNSALNLIGKTTYMESAEIFSRCQLLVSNDCGSVHLAAAVGTPVVGIYSSSDLPGIWSPWGKNHTVLRNDMLACRFCFRRECKTMECIKSITVRQVVDACRKYLKK